MLDWAKVAGMDGAARRRARLTQPSYYLEFLSRRWAYIAVPFFVISLIGIVVARSMPARYFSEGKLIVQPQRVSTELVRATVTGAAQDRLQVIQQRVMARDNIIEMADKFDLFPKSRYTLSTNDFVDLVKRNIRVVVNDPITEFGQRTRNTSPLIFSVGFEYSDPETAQKVANELIERFRDEDVRDRKERAAITTKFMTEEYEKLRAENAVLDAKVADQRAKLRSSVSRGAPNPEVTQLAQIKEELAQKSAVYSEQHPLLRSLRRQLASLESTKAVQKFDDGSDASSLEILTAQQEAANKALEQAAAKVAAAVAGENLERNQQSEKLEVVESAMIPQQSTKPHGRLKMLASFVAIALVVGLILAYTVDLLDTGIRSSSDIALAIDERLVTAIPYILAPSEGRRRSGAKAFAVVGFVVCAGALLLSAQAYAPKLESLAAQTKAQFSK